jgi:hypothetical protein
VTASQLLAAARVLSAQSGVVAGWRAVAVAVLARQALETAMDDLWRRKAPGTEEAARQTQLLCLPCYARRGTIGTGGQHLGVAFRGLPRAGL